MIWSTFNFCSLMSKFICYLNVHVIILMWFIKLFILEYSAFNKHCFIQPNLTSNLCVLLAPTSSSFNLLKSVEWVVRFLENIWSRSWWWSHFLTYIFDPSLSVRKMKRFICSVNVFRFWSCELSTKILSSMPINNQIIFLFSCLAFEIANFI